MLLAAAALLIFSVALVSQGRVFLRWRGADRTNDALEALGGALAYQAPIVVNNGTGVLSVYAFDQSVRRLGAGLNRTFHTDAFKAAHGTLAVAALKVEGRAVRLVLMRAPQKQQTLVIKIEQSPSEARASAQAPREQGLPGIPAYPGSVPVFFAKNEDTQMGLAVSTATCLPADVDAFFQARLPGLRWTPALPRQRRATRDRVMRLYHKGPDLCCVFAESIGATGGTRITLLHKRHGIK
jgi:hypothetical protein